MARQVAASKWSLRLCCARGAIERSEKWVPAFAGNAGKEVAGSFAAAHQGGARSERPQLLFGEAAVQWRHAAIGARAEPLGADKAQRPLDRRGNLVGGF